ncbi:hypothetical protein V1264_015184 [Littorina saxatilis]|uniref:Uncharacterized protein n=1 Tax=Littorina saxatilis TaxID=31220 RepID=A0AAN9BL60_9CAEN
MGGYYSREQKIRVNSNTGQNILAVDDSVYVQGTNATVQEIASIQADNQTDLVNAGLTGRSWVTGIFVCSNSHNNRVLRATVFLFRPQVPEDIIHTSVPQ